MKSLTELPNAIDYETESQTLQLETGNIHLSPADMRAAQARSALSKLSLLDFDYVPGTPEGAGGGITKWNPHSGQFREFNEYQRAAAHNGDPVTVQLARGAKNRSRGGLITKITCDTDKWPEAPFKSLTIRKGAEKVTIVKNPNRGYDRKKTFDTDNNRELSWNADALVAAGFLVERAVESIYESKMKALPARKPMTEQAEEISFT